MPLYVMLANMTQDAVRRCRQDEVAYNQQLKGPHENGEVLDFHPVVGQYDYVFTHAKDIHEAAKLSTELRDQMDMLIETMASLGPGASEASPQPPNERTGVRKPSVPPTPTMPASTARETGAETATTRARRRFPNRNVQQSPEP